MSYFFNLRREFPKAEITALAPRSSSGHDDGQLITIGRRSLAAGFLYTR